MAAFNFEDHPHRRYNPLTGEWLLVSPHRAKRPWKGKVEERSPKGRSDYDPDCYLCPRNNRAGGKRNPDYAGTYVFENDFPALLDDVPRAPRSECRLFRAEAVEGTCRVICFSPRHDLTLPDMTVEAIRAVVDVWGRQIEELGSRFRWVQVFENKGAMMGCSNPHPHGQAWATDILPNEAAKEDEQQRLYLRETGRQLLLEYADEELLRGERLVAANAEWLVLVPFWAVWPYELLVLPRRRVARLDELDEEQRDALASIMKRYLKTFDALFDCSFPYSMGWHGAPTDDGHYDHWQLHAHYYPPLLRSATVKKFMVGYEMLAEPQRDISAEQAAQSLRQHVRELFGGGHPAEA